MLKDKTLGERLVVFLVIVPITALLFGTFVVAPFLGLFGFLESVVALDLGVKLFALLIGYLIFILLVAKLWMALSEDEAEEDSK